MSFDPLSISASVVPSHASHSMSGAPARAWASRPQLRRISIERALRLLARGRSECAGRRSTTSELTP